MKSSYKKLFEFKFEEILYQGLFGEVCKVLFKVEIDNYLEVVVVKNKYRIDGVNIMEYMRVEEVYRYNRDKMIVFKFGIE